MTNGDYVFGYPGDRAVWQSQIEDAIKSTKLRWNHVVDTQWTLSGACPRCTHATAQYFDFNVVVAETIAVSEFSLGDRSTVSIEFDCLCDEATPHRKDTKGCGAGKGLTIELAPPSESKAAP